MNPSNVRRALISVYDKTQIIELARELHGELGIEIISTGGTANVLRSAGLPVTLIEELTGFPEMLDGRVKTLHPKIHAAILADRDNPAHVRQLEQAGIEPIDLVVVDLYPFEQTTADPDCTPEQAIEMIDIGGVALLRAAAKSHKHVLVLCGLQMWKQIGPLLRENGQVPAAQREQLAHLALLATSRYDAHVSAWLSKRLRSTDGVDDVQTLRLPPFQPPVRLRYGENPQQTGAALPLLRDAADGLVHASLLPPTVAEQRGAGGSAAAGEATSAVLMSYNNYLDADAALGLCAELTRARLGSTPTGAADGSITPRAAAGESESRARGRTRASGATDAAAQAEELPATAACVFIKHTNACGAAVARAQRADRGSVSAARAEAYRRAYLSDPNAAMGGILAVNFPVDAELAALVLETFARFGRPLKDAGAAHAPGGFFVEVWLAPRFTGDAVALIRGTYDPAAARPEPDEPRVDPPPRKDWGARVRLLAVGDLAAPPDPIERHYRSIAGGMLAQSWDAAGLDEHQWRVVTRRGPTERELADLRLAWLICKHTKSNAITICRDGMLIGNGAGQMSRVMSCRLATWLARENAHLPHESGRFAAESGARAAASPAEHAAGGPVAASDAFFPFPDGPQTLIDAGTTALIQPGGGKRDADVIAACDQRGVAMIFTGTRHFRH